MIFSKKECEDRLAVSKADKPRVCAQNMQKPGLNIDTH